MKIKTIFGILLATMLVLVAVIPIGILKAQGVDDTLSTITDSEASQDTGLDQGTTSTSAPTEPSEPADPNMHVSNEMLAVLKQLEGFRPYAYWDYKQWSIGYGSVCPAGKEKYYQENPITQEYAEELLMTSRRRSTNLFRRRV